MIVLPRQARDKHEEGTLNQKEHRLFMQGKQVLATANGFTGDPTQVNGVVWNPWRENFDSALPGASPYDFVSFGVKHIKFWSFDKLTRALTSDGCTFDKCETPDKNYRLTDCCPSRQNYQLTDTRALALSVRILQVRAAGHLPRRLPPE